MHSFDTNVSAFLVKLWKLVEDPNCDDLISWSDCGDSFIIRDQATFAKELLPQYFKHNNMASFIRQLNMYGFRKVANFDKGGLRDEIDQIQFCNPYFLKGEDALLGQIKRKIASAKAPVPERPPAVKKKADPHEILTDLTSIREKQETMNNLLISMKKENELLWRELSTLRKKHKTQEQIIQKVIQFLVSIVQSGKQNISMKRPVARMLENYVSSDSGKLSRQLDVLCQAKDLFFTVPNEKIHVHMNQSSSPLGPVIQEVNDLDHDEAIDSNHGMSDHRYNRPHRFAKSTSSAEMTENFTSKFPQTENVSILSPVPEDETEHILGIPTDFLSVDEFVPNIASVVSVSDDSSVDPTSDGNILESDIQIPSTTTIADGTSGMSSMMLSNVISIPEDPSAVAMANCVSDLISVPEGTDVLTLLDSNMPKDKDNLQIKKELIEGEEALNLSSDLVPFMPVLPKLNTSVQSLNISVPSLAASEKDNVTALRNLPEDYEFLCTPEVEKAFSLCGDDPNHSSLKKNGFDTPLTAADSAANLQVSLPDMTSLPSDELIAKNAFSNHVQTVEEDLDWLQNQLSSEILNVDPSLLLSLFSTDEEANNISLESKLCLDNSLRNPDSSIMGNELVQFNPSMLDFGDVGLLDCLNTSLDDQISTKTQNLKRERQDSFSEQIRKTGSSSTKKHKTGNKAKRKSK